MKTSILFGMIALLAFVSFSQTTFAIETEQEPGPPQIPEPSPIPEPIRMPDPTPTPNPFPEEPDSEKVKRLLLVCSCTGNKIKSALNFFADAIMAFCHCEDQDISISKSILARMSKTGLISTNNPNIRSEFQL